MLHNPSPRDISRIERHITQPQIGNVPGPLACFPSDNALLQNAWYNTKARGLSVSGVDHFLDLEELVVSKNPMVCHGFEVLNNTFRS